MCVLNGGSIVTGGRCGTDH